MNQDAKKIIKWSLLTLFFLFMILYAAFRSKDLIFGVKIRNVNILNGTKVDKSILNITGNAKNAVTLNLNGRVISIDQQGNFNETIALLPGYNVVNIKAEDKFGHRDEKNYQLIYSPRE